MDTHTLPENFVDGRDFARIARVIRHIDAHFREQPRLAELAEVASLSEFHFNRLFRRWAGLTPKQYLAVVTARAAHDALGAQTPVLEAAHAVGLSGPGRLHDLAVSIEALTPGEIKAQGQGVVVRHGFSSSPFGLALIGRTPRGLCHLAFVEPGCEREALAALEQSLPLARFERDDAGARAIAARLWGAEPSERAGEAALALRVSGTNFQVKVWQALLELGDGATTTYGAIASRIDCPGSVRAVGNAVGANPVAWLIPCHRVLRTGGALGGYRWGEDRKRAMLAWEALRGRGVHSTGGAQGAEMRAR